MASKVQRWRQLPPDGARRHRAPTDAGPARAISASSLCHCLGLTCGAGGLAGPQDSPRLTGAVQVAVWPPERATEHFTALRRA